MLKLISTKNLKQEECSFSEIREILKSEKFFWVDVEAPTKKEVHELGKIFNLHSTEIKKLDSTVFLHPKLEVFEDHLFVLMHGIVEFKSEEEIFDTEELVGILGKNYLLTVHSESLLATNAALLEDIDIHLNKGVDWFFAYLVNQVVRSYEVDVKDFEHKIEDIEERIFFHAERKLLFEGFKMKKEIQHLKAIFFAMMDILERLGNEKISVIENEVRIYFRDTYDFLNRLDHIAETYHGILGNVADSYLSVTSEKTNNIIKVLTFVSIVILPANIIAGIFGMNFKHTPLLMHEYGFWMGISMMALLGTIIMAVLKLKKWW